LERHDHRNGLITYTSRQTLGGNLRIIADEHEDRAELQEPDWLCRLLAHDQFGTVVEVKAAAEAKFAESVRAAYNELLQGN